MADLVNYAYYSEVFRGPAMDQEDFDNALKWATARVNQITFGRICKLDPVPTCVKDAICEAVKQYHAYVVNTDKCQVASESNDGYSVSYAKPKSESEFQIEIHRVVKMYLSGTGLTYAGTSPEYDQ